MPAADNALALTAFDLRSAALTLVVVMLKTADPAALRSALDDRFGSTPDLFDGEPVAIDLSQLREADEPVDFAALIALLREHGMVPIAARGGSAARMAAARDAGLIEAPAVAGAAAAAAARADNTPAVEEKTAAPAPARTPVAPPPALRTMVVDKPLRSGQRVYAKGCDLVVLAVVSYGAEVIADGSIHVYAPLRGRAIAGALGNTEARIFSTCMEPQLVSIAGMYRAVDTALPADVLGKPAQVRLDGEKLVVEALKS
jgi:septum site-determining protein MinC